MLSNEDENSLEKESPADVTQASTIPCSTGYGDDSDELEKLSFAETNHPILNFAGDVEDFERGKELFFSDGVCRIDYIIAWTPSKAKDKRAIAKEKTRNIFIKNLRNEGLVIEEDVKEGRNVQFVKIHAPFEVLVRYADSMKLRMPIKEKIKEMDSIGFWDRMTGCIKRALSPFELDDHKIPHMPKKFTCVFQKEKCYLYDIPEQKEEFFTRATRVRIVDFILRRTEYSDDENNLFTFGIKNLLANGTYTAAYPLHEGSYRPRSRMSYRKLLYNNWASCRMWYKVQPLQYIRLYYGEKVAFYFAWLGYYTYALIPASIVGLLVFIYGIVHVGLDPIAKESCDKSNMFVMCPKCYKRCGYWGYHRMCFYILFTHLFDNAATVFFAAFMALWGTIFLEFWKREQASLQFMWDLKNFEEEEEPPRPEYLIMISESKYQKKNHITGKEEPYHPFWKRRLPVYLTSASIMFFLVLLALAVVVGVIVYRISLLAVLNMLDQPILHNNAPIVVSVSAAVINLILIFILNFVYEKLAIKLTDWECQRTQQEYDDSLRYKMYILQFINYYSSLFYIAFFKGRFIGAPSDYSKFLGARLEECDGGSCLTELCIQLAIIFIGKQLIQNNILEIFLPRIKRCFASLCKKKKSGFDWKPWEKDFNLQEMGSLGLLREYLEMMIQFGFVTLFVAAFPLAPVFALLNNIIEIRADANKFVTLYRRPLPTRAISIGVWYEILHVLSRVSIVTNACLIAFTSSFIERELYKRVYSENGTLEGFVNNSLAYFDVRDFKPQMAPDPKHIKPKYENTQFCRYSDYRHPPWSEEKYKYTTQHWHNVAAQFIFVVVFENVVVLISCLVAYIIPDMPEKVEEMMRRETIVVNDIILKTELNRAKGMKPSVNSFTLGKILNRAINTSEDDTQQFQKQINDLETILEHSPSDKLDELKDVIA